MSPELQALVEKVARAMWLWRKPPYPFDAVSGDELIDLRTEALAAIRVVAEATREVTGTMMRDGNNALAPWIAPAMHSAAAWHAMHHASVLGEALKKIVSTAREDVARVRDRLREPKSSSAWNAEAADMLDALLAERDAFHKRWVAKGYQCDTLEVENRTLTKERDAARAERDALEAREDARNEDADILIAELEAERDAARAEVERLREALERIGWHELDWKQQRDIARVALAGKEPDA